MLAYAVECYWKQLFYFYWNVQEVETNIGT